MAKRCKICHSSAEIDENGRCQCCADVYNAHKAGMHYGDYVAQRSPVKIVKKEYKIAGFTKKCAYCGQEFWTAHNNQKYCNYTCQQKANYPKAKEWKNRNKGVLSKPCVVCGKEFTPSRNDARIVCCDNPLCRQVWRAKLHTAWREKQCATLETSQK